MAEEQGTGSPMDNFRQAGMRAQQNSAQLSSKIIDHAETNTREAFAALRAAAGLSSPADLFKLQGDYVRQQSERSIAQIKEIGEMITRFGRNLSSDD